MLYSAVGFVALVPFCATPMVLVLNETVFHMLFRIYLPQWFLDQTLLAAVCRVIYVSTVATLAATQGSFIIVSIIMFVDESNYVLKPGYFVNNPNGQINFRKAVRTYRLTKILYNVALSFGQAFYPSLILGGYVVNVVCTFAVIGLRTQLPILLVVGLAVFDVVVVGITIGIHKYALIIVGEVDSYFKFWHHKNLSPYATRTLNALAPIRLKVGPFFDLEPCTLLNTYAQVVDMTVTMLLA